MSEAVTTIERNLRKTKTGIVSSNKMDKTITVKVEGKVKHPLYGKFVKNLPNFMLMMIKMSVVLGIQ
jgi:small subunit ribosomal protein S17